MGRPKYRLDAASYFDPFAGEATWIQARVSRILGYPPFGDIYVTDGVGVLGYHDCYTEHCAIATKAGRAAYIAKETRDLSAGYVGTFIDDANFAGGNIPGPRASLADLIEETRTAIGPAAVIELNAQYQDIWPLMKAHDRDVERALAAVAGPQRNGVVTKEFGVGPTSGINTAADYRELMEYADVLKAKGMHITMTGDKNANDVPTMEYSLATYLLINDGSDYVNGHQQTPIRFWSGFSTNLGNETGPRERSPTGLWSRRFTGGIVYTVEPGAAPQTIKLGRSMHSAEWGTVESVTLAGGQGAVLVG